MPRLPGQVLFWLLCLLILVPYGQVWHFSFLNLDDDAYISQVPQLLQGWNPETWRWAWTTADPYLMPVVRLTFLSEIALFGLHSGEIHLVNLLFHAANGMLLFALFYRWTGDGWRSWLVAALFAVHPQHVEAVAWASERKEVMSAFFGLLALWSYSRYTTNTPHHRAWYFAALGWMLISLLCKPMWVTLPVLLLLLDYWPLQRFSQGMLPLVLEKIPFLLLGLLFSALTLFTFHQGDHLTDLQVLPLANRLANMLLGFGGYLWQTVWPLHLGLPHRAEPHLPDPLLLFALVAGFLLITGLVWRLRQRRPVLLVAWGWFILSLLPVSGLLEGGQPLVMADRRTYVPHMLLFAALLWSLPRPVLAWRSAALGWFLLLATLTGLTASYTQHWRTSITLRQHLLNEGFEPDYTRWALALSLAQENQIQEAIALVSQSHANDPEEAVYIRTLGDLWQQSGDKEKAWLVRRHLLHAQSPATLNSLREVGQEAFLQQRKDETILLLGNYWQRSPRHDAATAYALAVALGQDGQLEAGEQLWQEFLSEDTTPKTEKCAQLLALSLHYHLEDLSLAGVLMAECPNL